MVPRTVSERSPGQPPAGGHALAAALPLLVIVAAAVVVAALASSGTPHVPPRSAWLAIAGALVAACLLAPRRLRPAAAILGAAAAGAAAGHVLLSPGMPRVHDLMHLWGIWAYGRGVESGHLLPMWTPYLGAGIPLLRFYGPLNFLLALPGILSGLGPVGAWKLALWAGHVLSSLSALVAARVLGCGWRASLLAATALAFAPWRLANFDYRGALGEANAYLFLPLAAAAALRLLRRPGVGVVALFVLAVAGLVLTHLISLLTLALVLVPVIAVEQALAREAGRASLVRLGVLALAGSLALGVTAAWWMPALGELRHTAVRETTRDNPYYHYAEHGLSAGDLLQRRAWDRLRVSLPRRARDERDLEGEQMPFYAGVVLLALAVSAPAWSRGRRAWAPVAGVLAALLLSSDPAARALGSLPLLSPVRFPWRFLSPGTVLAALAVGLAADRWLEARARPGSSRVAAKAVLALLAVVAALVWDAAPYTGAADRIPPYRGVVHWYASGPAPSHWDGSMQAVLVEGIVPQTGGFVRVRDLALPPSDYATAVEQFFPGYYEWLTPQIYRSYWRTDDPARLAAAGVRFGFRPDRAEPDRWPARAYATLVVPGERIDAVPARNVARDPGRIRVRLDPAAPPRSRLVVLEQAFPGWRVRIDGGPWRAPERRRGFLALDLPAGTRRVEFVHGNGTVWRRAGLAVTAITLAALAAAASASWRRRGRERPQRRE